MVKLLAHLRDTLSGDTLIYENDFPHDFKTALYHWTEGNYGCDCNRSLFLWNGDEAKELRCNTGDNQIVLDSLTRGT